MTKELIDKTKIHKLAVELAADGKLFHRNTDEHMKGLVFEEQAMLLSFVYIELLFNAGMIPKEKRNQLSRVINTQVQDYARSFRQYREFAQRQIKLTKATDEKRIELVHSLKSYEDEKALQQALELIDMYEFGIAESRIYENIYLNRERKGA